MRKIISTAGWLAMLAVNGMQMPEAAAKVEIAVNGEIGQAEFLEGKKIVLEAVLTGGCSITTTDNKRLTFPTLAASIILPTTTSAVVSKGKLSGSTSDAVLSDALRADLPVIYFLKPFTDPLWQSISSKRGLSANGEEVFNTQWQGGLVDDEQSASLKLSGIVSAFKPESCIKQARVYLPTIQYCAAGYSLAAVNAPGSDKSALVLNANKEIANAPYLTIKRDLSIHPLPLDCADQDDTLFVYPADVSIDVSQMTWNDKLAKAKLKTTGVQRAASKWPPKAVLSLSDKDAQCLKEKGPGYFWHAAMDHCMKI